MATLKQRLHRKNSSGTYDTIHFETSADLITGTLSVAHGGTGVTSNPSMLTNLASTSAASVFAASPRPGVTGTLPVTRGGTGVTSLDALKTALGISSDQITYFSEIVTATNDNRTVDKTITISGTIKFVVLLTCYYEGGIGIGVDYRIACPSEIVEVNYKYYFAPVSNIFIPTGSATISVYNADTHEPANVGPYYLQGWRAGEINVTTTKIVLTAYAAEGSYDSIRSVGTVYFSGLVWYN